MYGEIHHPQWRLQLAEVEVRANTLARYQEVVAWPIVPIVVGECAIYESSPVMSGEAQEVTLAEVEYLHRFGPHHIPQPDRQSEPAITNADAQLESPPLPR